MKLRLPLIIFLVLLFVACTNVSEQSKNQSSLPTITLESPSGYTREVFVEIADEPAEQAKGLMFRESLLDDHGMLFVFGAMRPRSFWMKNTLIPLDIIYFDADGQFVSTVQMQPCKKDPCKNYPSAGSAQFALEVPAGYVGKYGVGPGWKLIR